MRVGLAEVLSLVTGENFTAAELEKTGERVVNIARLFNQREGFTGGDDSLPERIFKDPLQSGATAGRVLPREEFDRMLAE